METTKHGSMFDGECGVVRGWTCMGMWCGSWMGVDGECVCSWMVVYGEWVRSWM